MSGDFFGWFSLVGAAAFGVVIGWVTYGILRRSSRSALSDITTVIGAVGGAAVTGLFSKETGQFAAYSIGLFIGFFAYLWRATRADAPDWLGEAPRGGGPGGGGGRGGLPPIA